MRGIEFIAIAYWPMVVAGVFLFRRQWRKTGSSTKRQAFLVVTAFAALVAFTILLYGVIGRRSALTLAVTYGFPIAGGAVFFGIAWYCLSIPQKSRNWFAAGTIVFFGLLFSGLGIWWIAGDFVFPRHHLEATVGKLEINDTRSGLHYRVELDGRRHNAVGDVYESLKVGDRIRAEVGAGSGTIFRFEKI